jgi:hypothetical protein
MSLNGPSCQLQMIAERNGAFGGMRIERGN